MKKTPPKQKTSQQPSIPPYQPLESAVYHPTESKGAPNLESPAFISPQQPPSNALTGLASAQEIIPGKDPTLRYEWDERGQRLVFTGFVSSPGQKKRGRPKKHLTEEDRTAAIRDSNKGAKGRYDARTKECLESVKKEFADMRQQLPTHVRKDLYKRGVALGELATSIINKIRNNKGKYWHQVAEKFERWLKNEGVDIIKPR